MTRQDQVLASVEALLDSQRDALLSGDLDALAAMPVRLERALATLAAHRPPPEHIARIAQAARHNARLLQAAQRGVLMTRARLGAVGTTVLTTYDATGRQAAAPDGGRLLARR